MFVKEWLGGLPLMADQVKWLEAARGEIKEEIVDEPQFEIKAPVVKDESKVNVRTAEKIKPTLKVIRPGQIEGIFEHASKN